MELDSIRMNWGNFGQNRKDSNKRGQNWKKLIESVRNLTRICPNSPKLLPCPQINSSKQVPLFCLAIKWRKIGRRSVWVVHRKCNAIIHSAIYSGRRRSKCHGCLWRSRSECELWTSIEDRQLVRHWHSSAVVPFVSMPHALADIVAMRNFVACIEWMFSVREKPTS